MRELCRTGRLSRYWVYCILASLALLTARLHAQEKEKEGEKPITVTNFYMAGNDLSASNNTVLDQNGEVCALIRVQTIMKGFNFDVGSLGVQKVEDNHPSEIWVFVPHGVRHISIRHSDIGALPNYDFPISIEASRTYIMEITTKKAFFNNYDDKRKQLLKVHIEPPTSTFILNGMRVPLDKDGNTTQEMSLGTFTYKIENDTYYPREGQISIEDPDNPTYLTVTDLKPIMGKLSVHVSPHDAEVLIDGKAVPESNLKPVDIQIGQHSVEVRARGYRSERRSVVISENRTSELSVSLSQLAVYKFETRPTGAKLWINDSLIGYTPANIELVTGSYRIEAERGGYRKYDRHHQLASDNPLVDIKLVRIYNFRNEFYAEANYQLGGATGVGATVGFFMNNVNLEVGYLSGMEKTETIYWNSTEEHIASATYKMPMRISAKTGYGFPIMNRMRFTPQVGFAFLKVKSLETTGATVVDGAYAGSLLAGARLSFALTDLLAISASPEYAVPVIESDGYKALSGFVPSWSKGFNVKLGVVVYF